MKRWENDDGSQTIEPDDKKPEPPERVYQCRCGSVSFRLHSDGAVVCAECNRINCHAYVRFHGRDLMY